MLCTSAWGAPISKPIIKEIFALDAEHIGVFWQKGLYTNGPLKGYKLRLYDNLHSSKQEKVSLSFYSYFILSFHDRVLKYFVAHAVL